ncbi:MAG TPA: GIY-YIG nuclease family protein [Patescibacteria group bacterium]|nr:GIY-YIG nuclease family protein [Patescibacteria group bacterium]
MYYVYILKSEKTKKRYIGSTDDVTERLAEHNSGKTRSTRYGRPWYVIYTEEFKTKSEAQSREYQLKRFRGGEALKKLLARAGTEAVKRG